MAKRQSRIRKTIPHLTENGIVYVRPSSKRERSAEGRYWNAVGNYLNTGNAAALQRFKGKSIHDKITGNRYPFIVTPAIILEYESAFDFGPTIYRDRSISTERAL